MGGPDRREGEELRLRARRRILSALDEIVAQCTVQAELLERQDGAAPVLVTGEVVEWVRRVALALVRYGEGEYARAAALADITGVGEGGDEEDAPV
jgi:hypothetical protein